MAEKISDDEFKSEVLKFIEVANQKFDGLTADVRTSSFKLDRLENSIGQVDAKLESVASDVKQLKDVAVMAIQDHPRVDKLEKRVDDLEAGVH